MIVVVAGLTLHWAPGPFLRRGIVWCGKCLAGWLVLGAIVSSLESRAAIQIEVSALEHHDDAQVGYRRHVTSEQMLAFTNSLSSAASVKNRILENGSGVALGDINGDSLPDIYLAALEGGNRLYLNRGGFRFEQAPVASSVECPGQSSSGVLLADLDGDLDLDLVVGAIDQRVRLFLNDGQGNFAERLESGLSPQVGSTSLAASDIDLDGDLDLYVAHYRKTTVKDEALKLNLRREDGLWVLPENQKSRFISTRNLVGRGILLEQGLADSLYLNDGHGFFRAVPWTDGFFRDEAGEDLEAVPLDWSLSASFADVNSDGYPDLYVCSDFISPDRFWINQQGDGFQALSRTSMTISSWSSMCVDWADVNRDGHCDFFVGDMLSRSHQRRHYQRANHTPNAWPDWAFEQRRQYMRNTFYVGGAEGDFAELARFAGLEASEWTWNCAWVDVDRDGFEDLLITNGHPHDSLDSDWTRKLSQQTGEDPAARLQLPALKTANLAFRNGGQLSFDERGADWGFSAETFGQGMALADLDGDGDRDIVVNALNSAVEIYEDIGRRPLVKVMARELRPGRTAVGTRLTLSGGGVRQTRELRAGGRYLSADSSEQVFGVESLGDSFHLIVRWSDGEESTVSDISPNSAVTVSRLLDSGLSVSERTVVMEPSTATPQIDAPQFEDLSSELDLVHVDGPFDDSTIQASLTQQLSAPGLALGWVDQDSNRWDDVILGGGARSSPSVATYTSIQGWTPALQENNGVLRGDQVSLASWENGQVLIAASGYEKQQENPVSDVDVISFLGGRIEGRGAIPVAGAISAVTTGDLDLDGDLDVFVGGRFEIGRYPRAARSQLLLSTDEGLRSDAPRQSWPQDLGMVAGALFCHLNEDAWIDLAVVEEWGGLRVFLNEEGVLREQTRALGLEGLSGIWQSLDCGDLNGDGRLDLVLGNWGRNRFPVPKRERPLRLYYGESRKRGDFVTVEAVYDENVADYVPVLDRDRCLEMLPELRDRFPSYRSFGEFGIEAILEPHLKDLAYRQAAILDSLVLLRTHIGFEMVPLPWEAQISPVFGMSVADFNGDAREDLFLSQNFYGTELPVAPFDAGRGLLLIGHGDGKFSSLDSDESGIHVRGAGRASAVSDFDRDGRWDLLVGRHNRSMGLFRNLRGPTGLRVKLSLEGRNDGGIGALLRIREGDAMGPVRMLTGGGGDGAQDTLQPILFSAGKADQLWVRWPDGHETETDLPKRCVFVLVREDGSIAEWESR